MDSKDGREQRSHCFALVAVWPNGHGVRKWATAATLHAALDHYTRSGAAVAIQYAGRAAEPQTAEMPAEGYPWDGMPTILSLHERVSALEDAARVAREIVETREPQPYGAAVVEAPHS